MGDSRVVSRVGPGVGPGCGSRDFVQWWVQGWVQGQPRLHRRVQGARDTSPLMEPWKQRQQRIQVPGTPVEDPDVGVPGTSTRSDARSLS